MKNLAVFAAGVVFTSFCQAQVMQKPATTENFRGLSAPSSKVVWASGTHGTYVRTTDGGSSWKVAQVPGVAAFDFRDVEAFGADMAYLLAAGPGEQSRVYKTEDGGKSWSLQFTNKDPKGFFDCMGFWDRDHGVAVGDPVNGKFQLITTENGKDWKPIPPERLPAAIDGEGAFAASGTCLVTQGHKNVWFATGGAAARVFHSADRGKTWEVRETPIAHEKPTQGIFSLRFRNARSGIAVGGDYSAPKSAANNIALTSDGGRSWILINPENSIYLSAVGYLRKHEIIAVGTNGFLYSDDGGKRWKPGGEEGFNALAIATCDSHPCYVAAGVGGKLEKFRTLVEVDASKRMRPAAKVGMLR